MQLALRTIAHNREKITLKFSLHLTTSPLALKSFYDLCVFLLTVLLTPSVHSADLLLHESHIYKPLQLEGRIHNKGIDVKEPGTGRMWDGMDTRERNIKIHTRVYWKTAKWKVGITLLQENGKTGKWDSNRNTRKW